MGLNRFSRVLLLLGVLIFFSFKAYCDGSDVSVRFLKTPLEISRLSTATFEFEVFESGNICGNCSLTCKLDDHVSPSCEARKLSYMDLHDGDHSFEVCINDFQGAGCASYNWTVDTVPPTAYVTAERSFTNALNISVDISFSELCSGDGGFGCASVNACNLLVYGPGQVIPSTMKVLQSELKFSLLVGLSSTVQYGRVVLVMDKNFCTDSAGNSFRRTANSSFFVHFDRRSVFVNLRTHIPEKLLQLNRETRTVEATNNLRNLKVYLYFSEPVLNSSLEIMNSLHTSEGLLILRDGKTKGNRRFGFLVTNISSIAIVTISFNSSSIISRQGTAVSPIAPVTFIYGTFYTQGRIGTFFLEKTTIHLEDKSIFTKAFRETEYNISHEDKRTRCTSNNKVHQTCIWFQLVHSINFRRAFAEASYYRCSFYILVCGKYKRKLSNYWISDDSEMVKYIGYRLGSGDNQFFFWIRFLEMSRSIYMVHIRATDTIVSVNVPENITRDVAGNKNLASNILQVRHYTIPVISYVLSIFTTAAFTVTSLVAGLLTISTASFQSIGVLSRPSSLMIDPARNLFRIACHVQVFALSRWLTVALPLEYYEFARGLQWSIPYLSLPWETGHLHSFMGDSIPSSMSQSEIYSRAQSKSFRSENLEHRNSEMVTSVFGLPLTPMEYRSFFESHNIKPEAEHILGRQNSDGWEEFSRNMFWLAVIGGSLMLLHAMLLFILRCRRKSSEEQNSYGALVLPRFEIFLVILALPSLCQASMALVKGGRTSAVIVGILLLGLTSFLLLALLVFLSVGITFGKLLQYKEVHQEGQKSHWYEDIVRVTLGPGKRGQWTWKTQPNSNHLTMLGPLFEDLRGPPKYMLTQFAGGNISKRADCIIASDDETEDAEAPFIQKLFGILRIYYTIMESVKRVVLGLVAGVYSDNGSSRTPILVLLCITSFQLFFLVLKKPFIKKKVQLVEILSITSEVCVFATCLVLLEKKLPNEDVSRVGIFMLSVFLIAFISQMLNEWCALYRQILRLDSSEKHVSSGLKTLFFGLLLIIIPWNLQQNIKNKYLSKHCSDGDTGEAAASTDQYRTPGTRSSGTVEKPWLKQLRELAKASFSKETRAQHDPSSSQTRRSGFWSGRRSGSSSVTSSADFKSKPRALYRDLEAIFSSR
ncbi:hypothetical protein IFM89_011628 [Coptis chinensis]|uniref:Uncharacterized protein n=1 Tax=Coptis chinensis TaxID=261450 RepID=A0A835ISX3_9MAGN|nr:hypothetical protein IFM89_011628 [Coptis chinensis]